MHLEPPYHLCVTYCIRKDDQQVINRFTSSCDLIYYKLPSRGGVSGEVVCNTSEFATFEPTFETFECFTTLQAFGGGC